MSKFNGAGLKTGRTYEGGDGFARDDKSELFLLAVANFVGENTFYENGVDRDRRYADLIRRVAVADPEWIARFLRWLPAGPGAASVEVS